MGERRKKNVDFFLLFMYEIQHCFICRPSDSTVTENAGIGARTVATIRHWLSDALSTRLDLIHSRLDLIHTRLRHWQSDALTTRLDLIHSWLDLIHTRARSHSLSASSHPHSTRSHPPG
jgi:hypothetical protein